MKQTENIYKKYQHLLIFIFIVLTMTFGGSCRPRAPRAFYPVDDSLMEFDKKIIAQKFVKNVEYFRKYHIFDPCNYSKEELEIHYQKYPQAQKDPANFYIRYSYRFSIDGDDVESPLPTESQIIVNTDSIVYNSDATLCVAFLSIECNFDNINGLVQEYDSIHKYDAVAVVGHRPAKKDTIEIYPFTNLSVGKFESRENAIKYLISYYTQFLSHWSFLKVEEDSLSFSFNLGEEGFFDDCIFKLYDDSTYRFQVYHYWDKYNSCRYNYKY